MTATSIPAAERAANLVPAFFDRAADHDRDGSFPVENFEDLRAAGLLNLTTPAAHGGDGQGLAAACAVIGEVARGCGSTALVLAMQYIYQAVFAEPGRWPAEVHARFCRESVEGIALVNVMRVEPELGTPTRGGMPATTATPIDGGWSLSGHKLYATGSPILRWYAVWARTAGDDPRTGYFLVPNDTLGLRIEKTWDHFGMRATGSDDLILEDVRIPRDYAVDIRTPRDWMPPDPVTGAWNALVLAALYLGIARSARDWLVGYLHQRVPANLGASLATLPRFQAAAGEIEVLLTTSGRLVSTLAREIDAAGADATGANEAMAVKSVVTANAVRAVDIALQLTGNPGLSRHNPLERLYRDVRCGPVHIPQDDMVLGMAGRAALGL